VIDAAMTSAHSHDLHEARHKALLAMLMLSFGCGCLNDPLYPWIESTLTDSRIQGPTHRAARLEKRL